MNNIFIMRAPFYIKFVICFSTWFFFANSGYTYLNKSTPLEVIFTRDTPPDRIDIQSILRELFTSSSSLDKHDIVRLLTMNPRVKKIHSIQIKKQNTIYIDITVRNMNAVVHDQGTGYFSKIDPELYVLQSKIQKWDEEMVPTLPIISLPSIQQIGKLNLKQKTFIDNIVNVYTRTKKTFPSLWHRISEIEVNVHQGSYVIYTAQVRSAIHTQEIFDIYLLKKLWALFTYLESEEQTTWTQVYITNHNMYVQAIHE